MSSAAAVTDASFEQDVLQSDVPVLVDDGVRCRQALVVLLHHGGDLSPVDFHVFLQISGLTEAPATGGADVRSLSSVKPPVNWQNIKIREHFS